jgi:hypothetical protein
LFSQIYFDDAVQSLDYIFDRVEACAPIPFHVVDEIRVDCDTQARIRAFILKRGYQPDRDVYIFRGVFIKNRIKGRV